MPKDSIDQDYYLFTLSDIGSVCRKYARKIAITAGICSILACTYTLTKPVIYSVDGTFREKSKSGAGEKSLTSLLMSGGMGANDNATSIVFNSRKLAERVIKKLNLQAVIGPAHQHSWLTYQLIDSYRNVKKNLIVEKAYLMDSKVPALPDPQEIIATTELQYDGEIPKAFDLFFITDSDFRISKPSGEFVAKGVIGTPTTIGDVSFTLASKSPSIKGETRRITILPMYMAIKSISGTVSSETDKIDKALVKINYRHIDRHVATNVLNELMEEYRQYLIDDHRRISAEQIAYLKQRQDAMDDQAITLLQEHAQNITSNPDNIEFLISTLQGYRKKLLAIDLETKHLEKAQREGLSFYERSALDSDPLVIHSLLSEIRGYRQQSDSIDLVLRHNRSDEQLEAFRDSFHDHINSLQKVKHQKQEAKAVLALVDKQKLPAQNLDIFSDPKYMLTEWCDRLSAASKEDRKVCFEQFSSYLNRLIHLLSVNEKTLQDRLTNQQSSQIEFQGIDLSTANNLYLSYSRELQDIQTQILENEFIINQIQSPDFELGSLTTVLKDTISVEMVVKASGLILALKDQDNRTHREQERILQELDLQKGFLTMHLKEIGKILKIREDLVKEKIYSLQGITLELIQQKISILEKHLADYTKSRLSNLQHEREVILQHQQEMQAELDKMPTKWALQKLVDRHMESNARIIHEIAGLIESKNIAEQLEVSQSAPFDVAIAPIHPRDPHLILFALIGAFLGGLVSLTYFGFQTVSKGIIPTRRNLELAGQHVAGHLTSVDALASPESLETLRHLIGHLCPPQETNQTVLVLHGSRPNYSKALATLLSKRGEKVLILELDFAHSTENSQPGLLQYLQNPSDKPQIYEGEQFDVMTAGGPTLFSAELLESNTFIELLHSLKERYSYVIGVTSDPLNSAEAENLAMLFDAVAVSIDEERLQSLHSYIQAGQSGKRVSFLLS